METRTSLTPDVKGRLRWLWLPPLCSILLGFLLERLLAEQYKGMSVQGQSVVDILVALSPLPGLVVVWFIVQRRRNREARETR